MKADWIGEAFDGVRRAFSSKLETRAFCAPILPSTKENEGRQSSWLNEGEMAVARTSENTGVYLPSAVASPFIFSEAIGKACAVVILKQAAMRLLGINGITVHRART